MNEHFDAQINAFANRRTPMTLFYAVGTSAEAIDRIDRTVYSGEGDVPMPAGFEFVEMNGAMPVFKQA